MSLETDLHPPPDLHGFLTTGEDDDGDTASQRSISLSSPAVSPRSSVQNPPHHFDTISNRASNPYTLDTDLSSEPDDSSMFTRDTGLPESPNTSAAPSVYEEPKDHAMLVPTYPPSPPKDDTASIASVASGSSRKARPESVLVLPGDRPLILGIALVDFNHLVGPRIEYSSGEIFEDEEVIKILPFLALPDGAHLSAEDYSYFHMVPSGPNPTTIFGISCNQQIAASALLVKMPDVTRSTVQKAVVVLASKPIFGPIRDKLGVVTTALFNQRDFRETAILDDFGSSLEQSLRGQLTESGLYMGTNLRELVHTFRQRTLVLVKALMLQKRIMFYGHPVERLCTYQYSLVSLLPGLLQTLDDCGSPPLAARAPTLTRPTSLRTSDRKSMMAYTGLPLDIFGKDAFFQPYLPLQQLDVAAETKSWLCGSTNSIVTARKEVDLLVNTETGLLEFRDPKLERSAGLTPADRKWMDDIVKDVNDGWNDEDGRPVSIMFKGSDDYLRTKFEEYISAALSSVRYRDFVAKGEGNGVIISGGSGGDATSTEDFNPVWISEFKQTNAYEVWERTTDPLLFDIVEPRHPCNEKPSVVADIGLRLQEGIQDLKLEQQLAPAREAVARTLTAGSTNFFKAVEGVRGRWNAQRESVSSFSSDGSGSGSGSGKRTSVPAEVVKVEVKEVTPPPAPPSTASRPLLLARHSTIETPAPPARPTVSSWGSGIGSFLSKSKFTLPTLGRRESAEMPPPIVTTPPASGSPHSTTPSFLGMMSPAGITSPSVFPPTPLDPGPPTALPLPSPNGLRSLSLLTPVATTPTQTLPVSNALEVPAPSIHAQELHVAPEIREEPSTAPKVVAEPPVVPHVMEEPPVSLRLSPTHDITHDIHPPSVAAPGNSHPDSDHDSDTDETSFSNMAL
ncbi:transport protein Avl9-domain-containing protein [Mycena belliarum]|uniref:Transport protein Avl9-domain-containing protein n=1 Tax=Mycena belliarum TaxID=1033014 RepID=A0AAD6TY84_9AGAR|nr:transport protein Avl9-domain-containing protein [Mycena belliae]